MKSVNATLKKSQKGQLGGLTGNVIALVVAVIVLVMGLVIIQEIRDTDILSANSALTNDTAFQATNASLVGLGDFADFIPIIVIAVAASVIIGLILVGFAFTRRQR